MNAAVVLYQHFLQLGPRVKQVASHNEVCMRIITVPGVRPIASLALKAAIDETARFKLSRLVWADAGSDRVKHAPLRGL